MAVRHRIRRAVEECWERFDDQGAESRQTRGTPLGVLRRSESGKQWVEAYMMVVEPIEYGWRP